MPGAVVECQPRFEPDDDGTRLPRDWTITSTRLTRLVGPLITLIGRRKRTRYRVRP